MATSPRRCSASVPRPPARASPPPPSASSKRLLLLSPGVWLMVRLVEGVEGGVVPKDVFVRRLVVHHSHVLPRPYLYARLCSPSTVLSLREYALALDLPADVSIP